MDFGISRDGSHAKLAYDWYGSWTTLYNLYGDTLLCFHLDGEFDSTANDLVNSHQQQPLNEHHSHKNHSKGFVPHHVYDIQSDWYHAVRQRYGLPMDSRHLYTKTDWEFFATSIASDSVRKEIWESYALWINETTTGIPTPENDKVANQIY